MTIFSLEMSPNLVKNHSPKKVTILVNQQKNYNKSPKLVKNLSTTYFDQGAQAGPGGVRRKTPERTPAGQGGKWSKQQYIILFSAGYSSHVFQ